MSDVWQLTAADALRALRRRDIGVVEYVEALLDRIAARRIHGQANQPRVGGDNCGIVDHRHAVTAPSDRGLCRETA